MPRPTLTTTNTETRDESDVSSLLSATSTASTSTPASAIAQSKLLNPTPRTPNRVRFALDEDTAEDAIELREHPNWADREDYLHSDDDDDDDDIGSGRRSTNDGNRPLLTDIEAPSVAIANELEEEHNRPKSGMRMAFMNMANSIIGAGIIGQPYAFKQAGLGMGIFLLVSLTIIVDWTINLIVINSKLSGANSFQSTMSVCFGKKGLIAISIAQWAFAFGGMIAFCIIIGDTIPHVVLAVWPSVTTVPVMNLLANRQAVIVIFTMGISYPLTLYRDIAKLAKASAFALASMFIIVITVITQGFRVPASARGELSLPLLTINTGIFQAVGVISFAFVCHHNSLLIYGSLRTPTLDRFASVTHYSTTISLIMCLLLASSGFLTFRSATLGNVLNNFPADNTMVNIARFCFGLNMLTTLPLEAFVCREVMETYFWPDAPFGIRRHVILSTGLTVTAMAVALSTCDLGAVFELIGATSACALAYIFPPLCYIKLATRRDWKTKASWGVAGFGTFVMVVSLGQTFWKMAHGGGEKAVCM